MYPSIEAGLKTSSSILWGILIASMLSNEGLVEANAANGGSGVAQDQIAVKTASQLQQAVRSGKRHVIINDHLDLTQIPRFADTTALDTSVLAVRPNPAGQYTASIQVCISP